MERQIDRQIDQDKLFSALADPRRRLILGRLSLGPMTVSQLAQQLEMSLPLVMQHLAILEASGFAVTEKTGRVRTCRVDREGFHLLQQWINNHKMIWEGRMDRLFEMMNEGSDQ